MPTAYQGTLVESTIEVGVECVNQRCQLVAHEPTHAQQSRRRRPPARWTDWTIVRRRRASRRAALHEQPLGVERHSIRVHRLPVFGGGRDLASLRNPRLAQISKPVALHFRVLSAGRLLASFRGMRNRRPIVNTSSRFALLLCHVCLVLAAITALPTFAQADRVVYLPVVTEGVPLEASDDIEDTLREVLRNLGHEVITDPNAPVPENANQHRALAEVNRAEWSIQAELRDYTSDAYWITLRVGYAPETRVQELVAEVRKANETERLEALLTALIKPEGISEADLSLAGADTGDTGQSEEEARLAEELDRRLAEQEAARLAEEEARLAEEAEAERLAAEEAEAEAARAAEAEAARLAEENAYENRDRYGVADGANIVLGGVGVRPLVSTPQEASGGTLGFIELTYGRGFEGAPGLELRANVDVVFGASGGFTLHGGVAYLFSPFVFPLHLGATVSGGIFVPISGSRSPGALVRASALVSYNLLKSLYLEASLPEFTWLSVGGGAIGLGASVRLGVRF